MRLADTPGGGSRVKFTFGIERCGHEDATPDDDGRSIGTEVRCTMAVSKPIRVLAAACMTLFFFLMLQMMRNPNPITPPLASQEKDDFQAFVRDPNLDGMLATSS